MWSFEPDKTVFPSGLKAALFICLQWPCKVLRHSPPDTDHSFKVLSFEPDRTVLPSGLKATLLTQLLWPCKVLRPFVLVKVKLELGRDLLLQRHSLDHGHGTYAYVGDGSSHTKHVLRKGSMQANPRQNRSDPKNGCWLLFF